MSKILPNMQKYGVACAILLLLMGMPQFSENLKQRKEFHDIYPLTNIFRLIKEGETGRARGMYESFSGTT
jgi:hypothetical protein